MSEPLICAVCGGDNARMDEFTCRHDFDHYPMTPDQYATYQAELDKPNYPPHIVELERAARAYGDIYRTLASYTIAPRHVLTAEAEARNRLFAVVCGLPKEQP